MLHAGSGKHGAQTAKMMVDIEKVVEDEKPKGMVVYGDTNSTLAGACAYFMVRRYSIWFGIIVIPVLLFTMYVRFMLDMHTISATIAGAGTGILVSAIFATTLPNFNMHLRQFLRLPIKS